MELPSHPGEEWEDLIISKGISIAHDNITKKFRLHLIWHWNWRRIMWDYSDFSWNIPARVGYRMEDKYKRHSNQHKERGQKFQQICESCKWGFVEWPVYGRTWIESNSQEHSFHRPYGLSLESVLGRDPIQYRLGQYWYSSGIQWRKVWSTLDVESYTGTTFHIFYACQDQVIHRSITSYW